MTQILGWSTALFREHNLKGKREDHGHVIKNIVCLLISPF